MIKEVDTGPYMIRFGMIYIAAMVVLGLVFQLLDRDAPTVVTFAILIYAAMMTSSKFIKDQQRLPTSSEKKRLAWQSLGVSWLISMIGFAVLMMFVEDSTEIVQAIASIPKGVLAGVIIFVSLLYLFLLSFAYSFLARKQFKGMQKRGEI